MGILGVFKANLQQLQVESQRELVIRVLRASIGEMTLDDLRTLLASPLGRGLGKVRVGELLAGETAAATPPRRPEVTTRPKSKPKKKRAKTRNKRTAKVGRAAAARKDLRAHALETLQSAPEPLNLRELVEVLGADRRTVRKALVGLLSQGSIVASGKAPKLRYAVPEKPQEAQKTASAPRAKNAVRVSGRTIKGRATYEAAVLAALRDKGEQTPLSVLIKETGGTDNQLRAALRRLIAAGKVDRTGERDRTRYSVRRQPPST
jgi:hypothetical protein